MWLYHWNLWAANSINFYRSNIFNNHTYSFHMLLSFALKFCTTKKIKIKLWYGLTLFKFNNPPDFQSITQFFYIFFLRFFSLLCNSNDKTLQNNITILPLIKFCYCNNLSFIFFSCFQYIEGVVYYRYFDWTFFSYSHHKGNHYNQLTLKDSFILEMPQHVLFQRHMQHSCLLRSELLLPFIFTFWSHVIVR